MTVTPFSEDELRARLRVARGDDAGHQGLSIEARYGRLAGIEPPEQPGQIFARLTRWPTELYRDATPSTRREILEWLVAHVGGVRGFDEKHGWLEQWHLELLRCGRALPGELETLAGSMQTRRLSDTSRRLYADLRARHSSPVVDLAWLRHLTHARAWGECIHDAAEILGARAPSPLRAEMYRLLVEALLERGEAPESRPSDVDRALSALLACRYEGLWRGSFQPLLERVTEAALPPELRAGRGEGTGLIAGFGRDLSRAGKWLGGIFGGRDAEVPHSPPVIANAPSMLPPAAVEAFVASSRKLSEEFKQAFPGRGHGTEAAVAAAALTMGGLWTLAQLDSSVLRAITFSAAAHPESLSRLQSVAEAFDGSDGAKTRLAGYVAEQRVAADLVREGHAVEFPAGPTQAGWDLLVDGHAVQVKCSTSADYVLDHFGRYPDVPVIVNAELADQLGDHPMVWIDAALSHEEVTDATDDSVAALADLGDADFLPIPLVALAFAAVRNAGDLTAGNIDGGTYAQRVGVDVAARGLGGGAGGAVGAVVVGALIGPVGAALGSIVGGVIGSIAGGTGADAINRNAVCDARDLVVRGLGEFAVWFRTTLLRPRIAVLELRHNQVTLWAQEAAAAGKAPAAVATFYAASAEMLNRAKRLDSWIAGREDYDDFARAQAGWVALREAPGFFHPELKTHLAALRDALDRYRLAAHPEAAHRQDAQTDALARAAVDLTNMMSEMGNVIGRLGTPQGDDDRVLCIDVGRTCTRYVVLPRRAGRKDVGACVVKVARTSGFDRHVLNATCTKATEHRVRPRAIAVAVPFPVDYGKEGSLVATCHSEQRVCVYNDAVAWAAGAAAYRRMWGADVPLPALALVLGSGVGLAVVAEEESIIALEVSDVPWRLHELRRISPGNDAGCPSDCGPAVHSICGNDFFAWVARDKSHWSEDKVREEYTARVRALVDDILQPISRAVGPVRAILVGGRHSAFVSRQKLGQGTSLSVDVLSKRELPVNPDLVALLGLLNLAQSRQALRVLPSKEAMRLIAR